MYVTIDNSFWELSPLLIKLCSDKFGHKRQNHTIWFRYLLFKIPSQVHEQRVLDELGSLKNEIHQLSEENIKLQSLLNDLNSSIKDQKKNAIDSKG